MMIFFSDRIAIERAFNEWAEEHGIAKVPNALVSFLEFNGLLNTEKTVVWCREQRQKKQIELCQCYNDEENFLHERGVCYGTKEIEPCSCGGNPLKCNFYVEKRNRWS